jgi:hypothetical protein
MVADGEIVVLRCKNVVIGWILTWWGSGLARVSSFLMQKNIVAWRCTRSRSDWGVKVVKCDGVKEEDAYGSILFLCEDSPVD